MAAAGQDPSEYFMSGALPAEPHPLPVPPPPPLNPMAAPGGPSAAAMVNNTQQQPGWTVAPQPYTSTTVQGVSYANPIKPVYTAHPQWGRGVPPPAGNVSTGYVPPSGGFQYAAPPHQIKYTATPITEKNKKKKKKQMDQAPPVMPPMIPPNVAQFQTMVPGGGGGGGGGPVLPPPMFPPGGAPPGAIIGPGPMPPPPMPGAPPGMPGAAPFPMAGPGFPTPPLPVGSPPHGGANIREMVPNGKKKKKGKKSPSPPLLSKIHRLSASGPRPELRAPSPGIGSRMNRLSVSGDRPEVRLVTPGGPIQPGVPLPPPSPMLEPYHGTYQSMPSPLLMPRHRRDDYDDDLEFLAPLSPRASGTSIHGGKPRRSVSISSARPRAHTIGTRSPSPPAKSKAPRKSVTMYAAEEDATDIATELTHKDPKYDILAEILPRLSHDQLAELTSAYKRVAKIHGRGINMAKHIKLKVSNPHLRLVAYVTALGRWESEAHWANFWYQRGSARRELLIESLMGRRNSEIRQIMDAFKDKRYNNSLYECMRAELKPDKFRRAVLTALEAERQEESDVWPKEYVDKDVDVWVKALRGREGGESAMLDICVQRSNRHLRECLKRYEQREGANFAKQALEKSQNLVGEVIAHILNGVINKPAREAMLLNHALMDLLPQDARSQSRSRSHSRSRDHSHSRSRSRSRSRSTSPSRRHSRSPPDRRRKSRRHPSPPRSRNGSPARGEQRGTGMGAFFSNGMGKDKERSREDRKERKDKSRDGESRYKKDRYELLVSRLVRLHWDHDLLHAVKDEYYDKYGKDVGEDVEECIQEGDFREFCLQLLDD